MFEFLPRDEFLRLLILKSTTLDQRVLMGQAAFAFGCRNPAHTGEYLPLDGVAMMLTSMLNAHGVRLEVAAEAVRTYWDDWLGLVTRAERYPIPENPHLFFAVAVPSPESGLSRRVAVGYSNQIVDALYRADDPSCPVAPISIHQVLLQLRINAQRANVALPDRLTIARGEPGYKNWRREIAAYRARAEARAEAKAKGRRAARAPAGKRLVTAN